MPRDNHIFDAVPYLQAKTYADYRNKTESSRCPACDAKMFNSGGTIDNKSHFKICSFCGYEEEVQKAEIID